jgi:predicted nicotinamide N-methyase
MGTADKLSQDQAFDPALNLESHVESHSEIQAQPQPILHRTPPEALTQVVQKTIVLEGRSFTISYPGNPDALLDHPVTHAAFDQDEYMPYWADLWPSAQMLGGYLLRQDWPGDRRQVLEIGCGVGLPGIIALALGMEVTFSDYDTAALDFASRNALANGFEQFSLLPLDWRVPPSERVDLLLASDVIYEQRNIAPLIQLIRQSLTPRGTCLLVDPNRPWQNQFRAALEQAQLPFKTHALRHNPPDQTPIQATLFEVCLAL